MRRLVLFLALSLSLVVPMKVGATQTTTSDDVDDTVTTIDAVPEDELDNEDLPFIKTKKVHITSKGFVKKAYLVRWDEFPGATGYQFKLCINKSFKKKYKPSEAIIFQNAMQINKIKAKHRYYFKIRAFRDSPTSREYSKWTKVYSFKKKKK